MSRSASPPASVAVQATPHGWERTLSGEFDIGNVQTLADTMDPLITERPDALVVLDAERVRFMDSATLAVLIRAAASGATVRLRQPSAVIEALVQASGLTEVLVLEQ